MNFKTVHPFPARMAPEIVSDAIGSRRIGTRVLDPMCGSGTVLRAAVERGLEAHGVDIDPLAVLMSRVWTTPVEAYRVAHDAKLFIQRAQSLPPRKVRPFPDEETRRFVSYWFAEPQRDALARLATVLVRSRKPSRDLLAIAMSRLVITKEQVASLARDTSHSRPHRVALTNDFDVYAGFLRSARLVAKRLAPERIQGVASVMAGDARDLSRFSDGSFDLVLTSPPYLNAIDYLRGHRLTLVWLGYAVREIRDLRAESVGAERILVEKSDLRVDAHIAELPGSALGDRQRGWVQRYARDMLEVLTEVKRVVRDRGVVILVVGNCLLRGAAVNNAELLLDLAGRVGLDVRSRVRREIPARRRYLPPPSDQKGGRLDARMRTEEILTLCVA